MITTIRDGLPSLFILGCKTENEKKRKTNKNSHASLLLTWLFFIYRLKSKSTIGITFIEAVMVYGCLKFVKEKHYECTVV